MCGQEGEGFADFLVSDHADDDVKLVEGRGFELAVELLQASFVVGHVEDDGGVFVDELPATVEACEVANVFKGCVQGFFGYVVAEVA